MNALKVCPQCGTEYPANARFCEIDGTALRSAAQGNDLVGSIVADRYHIMKKLGEGGMGQVYLAEHVKMGRKSALKVMHPGMVKDVDAISRFNREAANASRISHPNVAAVYDFGETPDGLIYLAMEFVDGPPLTSVIEQHGALPPKRAAEIARQTGEALAVAHDMGIVHRDLKPDNIMVAKTRDGGDLVKVVDFGIAKAAGNDAQKVTKTGLVVGTPEYMSPEQLAGDKLDGRSDIYSLGLVTFNMLTGKLPFPADSAQESMIMRLTDAPKPLREMRPEISWPADVQTVMDKALAREVSQRYQTATEFGRALYQAIDRMPETVAAELGTQMIGAVPATRVSTASPAGGAGATLAVPAPVAPVVSSAAGAPVAAPVAQGTAPAKKKNMIPVFGGVAAVVVAGAIVLFAMQQHGANGPAQPAASGTPPVQQAASDSTAGTQAGAPITTPSNSPAGSRDPGGSGTAGNAVDHPHGSDGSVKGSSSPVRHGDSPPDVGRTFARLEAQADTEGLADGVLTQINSVFGTLKNDDDRARADYIRYKAYATKNDAGRACTALKAAAKLATDPSTQARYNDLVSSGC